MPRKKWSKSSHQYNQSHLLNLRSLANNTHLFLIPTKYSDKSKMRSWRATLTLRMIRLKSRANILYLSKKILHKRDMKEVASTNLVKIIIKRRSNNSTRSQDNNSKCTIRIISSPMEQLLTPMAGVECIPHPTLIRHSLIITCYSSTNSIMLPNSNNSSNSKLATKGENRNLQTSYNPRSKNRSLIISSHHTTRTKCITNRTFLINPIIMDSTRFLSLRCIPQSNPNLKMPSNTNPKGGRSDRFSTNKFSISLVL
jgi:hypothetical protein